MVQAGHTMEADEVRIWVLTDNYYDSLRPDSEVSTHYRVGAGECIHAEHGLSYYIEVSTGAGTSRCMFDFGLDGERILDNARLLGLDLGKSRAFVLSHGHFDHWSGAAEILRRIGSPGGLPFYAGVEAFLRRGSLRPGSAEVQDIGQLKRGGLEALGVRPVEVREPGEILPGIWVTGGIGRETDYETPNPALLVRRGERMEQDDFPGELALFFVLKGKGLVVVSGCAHAGIVNTVRQAQKVSGVGKVHAVIGGFHLINAPADRIRRTIEDIRGLAPRHLIPAHCTGFEALTAFSRGMPGVFELNTAAAHYRFSALTR